MNRQFITGLLFYIIGLVMIASGLYALVGGNL